MEKYELKRDADGTPWIATPYRGRRLLGHNMYNKGTVFSAEERAAFGLDGLLPNAISTFEEQLERSYQHVQRKTDPLEKFIGLEEQRARNAVVFYRLILDHIEELLPIVYTPTVGKACQEYSHIFRRGRGLWITPQHRGRIRDILANAPYPDVRLIVVTDNERILGLGDQGAGGMGIPVGKLALYTVVAGIHPTQTLPVSLDVGTDNQQLLDDPLYVGWRKPRLRGEEYDSLVEEFVEAVKERFPNALLQWEDFKKANAFNLLDRYRERLLSFNDDIQGTAGIATAGVVAACRISGVPLAEQRIVIVGGGAAGIGIGRLLRDTLSAEGLSGDDLTSRIAILDSRGLLTEGREYRDEYKREFAWPEALAAEVGFGEDRRLTAAIEAMKPTVLIGTSGQPGVFDRDLVTAMASHVERPVIFPFSNPTSQSEAIPADLIEWTEGRALIATGSPFEPVDYQGTTYRIGQGNNVYIFPAVGLGALAAGARKVSESMFAAAAQSLAQHLSDDELEASLLFPALPRLRGITPALALAVAKAAIAAGVADEATDTDLKARIDELMWYPEYAELRPA